MFQIKEKDTTPEEKLSSVEIGNLPKKKFRIVIMKMIKELGRKMDEHRETFNKELGDTKKNQGELRNTITEIKNTPEYGIDSRLEDIEERISELEDRLVAIINAEQKKKIKKRKNANF